MHVALPTAYMHVCEGVYIYVYVYQHDADEYNRHMHDGHLYA